MHSNEVTDIRFPNLSCGTCGRTAHWCDCYTHSTQPHQPLTDEQVAEVLRGLGVETA